MNFLSHEVIFPISLFKLHVELDTENSAKGTLFIRSERATALLYRFLVD